MINFNIETFLNEYWQKKPLVIRNAIPNFINPLSADELAGLALDDDMESRIVIETPHQTPCWQLQTGPFAESIFKTLSKTHWTLLVQGVDRVIPPVMDLLDHFNFIPQWRVDDVMVSYASMHGSVGPHYDNYDVFLLQGAGRRQWSLTTKNCNPNNAVANVDLRIMKQFDIEETYILEAGDLLYLPAHVGHHGVSLDDDCMTYSFGYRSYTGQEMWDSFGDFLSEHITQPLLYRDPNWTSLQSTAAIPDSAWLEARKLLVKMLSSDQQMKSWFGCFATSLDRQAEQQMLQPLLEEEIVTLPKFIEIVKSQQILVRDPTCRMAYLEDGSQLFINGCEWPIQNVSWELIKYCVDNRTLEVREILSHLASENNQRFLYELWKLQMVQCS